MRQALALLAALALLPAMAACGGQDRTALAKTAVTTYWKDLDHGKIVAAYKMLTSGNQAVVKFSDYQQNMMGFLESVASVNVTAGTPVVNDDRATVPVQMHSPKSPTPLKAYQHLFWENGAWKISDQNGGLSQTK